MIKIYLSNKNKSATVIEIKKFWKLNKTLFFAAGYALLCLIVSFASEIWKQHTTFSMNALWPGKSGNRWGVGFRCRSWCLKVGLKLSTYMIGLLRWLLKLPKHFVLVQVQSSSSQSGSYGWKETTGFSRRQSRRLNKLCIPFVMQRATGQRSKPRPGAAHSTTVDIDSCHLGFFPFISCGRTSWIKWPTCTYHCLKDFWSVCTSSKWLKKSVGCPRETRIIHVLTHTGSTWSYHNITTFVTKITYIRVRKIYNSTYNIWWNINN